jgi:hypothetical protein
MSSSSGMPVSSRKLGADATTPFDGDDGTRAGARCASPWLCVSYLRKGGRILEKEILEKEKRVDEERQFHRISDSVHYKHAI